MRQTIGTYGTMTDVTNALIDFSGQENCDGPEYDAMVVAYEEINDLTTQLVTKDAEIVELNQELEILRAIVAPLLRHAERDDYSPPYMFNVCECRKIKEELKCS